MFDIFINTIIVLTVISFNLAIYMWAIVMHKQMTVYNKMIKPLLPEIQEFIQLAKHGMRNHINDFRKEVKENK